MFTINFVNPNQKMEFEEKEYLLTNYAAGNIFLDRKKIPYFAFDFTPLPDTEVSLEVLNFDTNTNTFNFVNFRTLDAPKLKANYFEGYETPTNNLGICRIVFKDAAKNIYKISRNLLSFSSETFNPLTPEQMEVVDGWIPIDINFYTVEANDNTELWISSADFTFLKGTGLKINGIITHFVKDAVWDGSVTTIQVTGVGNLPATIVSLSYKKENAYQSRKYWWSHLNNANEPSILALTENEMYWTGPQSTIVYAAVRNIDKGSNPNGGTVNFTINGNKLCSSNLAVNTGLVDCGVNLQNNIVKFNNEIKFETIIATGSNDVGRGLVEIIAFN